MDKQKRPTFFRQLKKTTPVQWAAVFMAVFLVIIPAAVLMFYQHKCCCRK